MAASSSRSDRLLYLGAALLSAAGLTGEMAWLHARETAQLYGFICGSGAGALAHCAWCSTSAALSAAGLTALAWSRRPQLRRAAAAAKVKPR